MALSILGMPLFPQMGAATAAGADAAQSPIQFEQPSFLEMLAAVAGQVYGGDSRYSAAAGLGNGISGVLGGLRERRNQQQQLNAVAQQYPEIAPLLRTGMQPKFADILKMQENRQEQDYMKGLPTEMQRIAALPEGAPRAAALFSIYGRAGWTPPGQVGNALVGGVDNEKLPGSPYAGYLRSEPGGVDSPEKLRAATMGFLGAQTAQAADKTGAEAVAKQKAEGNAPFLEKPTLQTLSRWGYDPKNADPDVVDQAADSVELGKMRMATAKEEGKVKNEIARTQFDIKAMKNQLTRMAKIGLPMDERTMAGEHGNYSLEKGESVPGQLLGAYITGPPGPEYRKLFEITGRLRTGLAGPYTGNIRAARWIERAQQHLSQIGTTPESMISAANQVTPLFDYLTRRYNPDRDPVREDAIGKLMRVPDPTTGRRVVRSHAEYLVDKLISQGRLKVDEEPPQ